MRTRTTFRLLGAGIAAATALFLTAPEAQAADWVIKSPSEHPSYIAELEPHANFILWNRYYGRGYAAYDPTRDPQLGGGFRASIKLMDPGFVRKINDTIAITFGLDMTSCSYRYCRDGYSVWTPVALQWNFYLTHKWSVFGEVGAMLHGDGFFHYVDPDFVFYAGARYHFNDNVALTMRLGYPGFSLGVSFFVGH